MTHSESRRGKKVKNDNVIKGARKSIYSMESLFEKAYNAKTAEGLAEGTLWRYRHAHEMFLQYLDTRGNKRRYLYLSILI